MSHEEGVQARIMAAKDRYDAAAHAVQSGVNQEMLLGAAGTEPKHMRTGIDMSKADMAGLVTLLMKKGVFTEVEYIEAMADSMEQEKLRYEEVLSEKMNMKITLG